MVDVAADTLDLVPVLDRVAAPALVHRGIVLVTDRTVDHREMHHEVALRWLVTLRAELRRRRRVSIVRDAPGVRAMTVDASCAEDFAMTIDMTARAGDRV